MKEVKSTGRGEKEGFRCLGNDEKYKKIPTGYMG